PACSSGCRPPGPQEVHEMRCLDPEALTEVVDGVAGAEALAHVSSCERCAAAVGQLEALGASLRALPAAKERASPSLHATLRGLEAGAGGERHPWRSLPGAVAAIAAAAALFLAPGGGGISEALADEASASHLR